MFIELTDHLRCPADHDEAYLVLLPDRSVGRDVVAGHLGCPVCGWNTSFTQGQVDFGGGTPASGDTALSPEAVHAFLGLGGPGGFVALVGAATGLIPDLVPVLRGIHLVAINPAFQVGEGFPGSVLRSAILPLKRGSMRGVVLGADVASDAGWVRQAARATLPGLRICGEGPAPDLAEVEVLASSARAWVAKNK
ncbi:MAG TPA: hypothetical protein VGA78_15730 [Gemmatimonadales bacterium]|jgi:hypothetical protein